MNKIAIYFIAAVAIGVVGSVLYQWKYDEWVTIPKARQPVQALMRDPASAQFRNERIASGGVLCGEVNSKNAMGGYVGFKKFISMGSSANYLEDHGRLEEATTDEFIARMDEEIAIMKRFTANQFEHPSKDQITQLAISNIFDNKWAELCGKT